MNKKTILIVDDEPNITKANARMFKANGWNTLVAFSVSQALELIQQADVVLSDYNIGSEGDGMDIIKAAGAIPVVIFSANSQDVKHAHVLEKPSPFNVVLDAVSKACEDR